MHDILFRQCIVVFRYQLLIFWRIFLGNLCELTLLKIVLHRLSPNREVRRVHLSEADILICEATHRVDQGQVRRSDTMLDLFG